MSPRAIAILSLVGLAAAQQPGRQPGTGQPPAQPPAVSEHWAWRPIERPALPAVADRGWCRQPLDRFVLARMQQQGLAPARAADRAVWLRRVALDLCGLPPTPAEVEAFLGDHRPDAFERQVDRLLQLPAFGERWALWWLDLARYADSKGYEKDALRPDMWVWRDWVVDAFRRDLPFDQFTIEQLAGDLLPQPTLEQRLATAFQRQTMTNDEGGTDDEEFRTAAVIDRVNTTMTVWMGSTVGCAQCHDHKYDPITQREYYQLFAFFDQTADSDRADEAPTLAAPTAAQRQRLSAIDRDLAGCRQAIEAAAAARAEWLVAQERRVAAFAAAAPQAAPWHRLGPLPAASFDAAWDRTFACEPVRPDRELEGLQWQPRPDLTDGTVHQWEGENAATFLYRTIEAAAPTRAALMLGSDDAIRVWWNGRKAFEHKTNRAAQPDQEAVDVDLCAGRNELLVEIVNGGGPAGFCFELRAVPFGVTAEAALHTEAAARDAAARAALAAAFAAFAEAVREPRARIEKLERERAAMRLPMVPVLQELPADRRRTTRVHLRGSYLAPGEEVQADVPACWPPLPAGARHDRLALARWLVSGDNPLTARVQVNRAWEQLFGRGLVATSGDFGTQGDRPTHPALLDWLAGEFVDDHWSWQHLLRRIVLSATYRQSAVADDDVRARDRDNVWITRGPNFRLPGELLRDQALAVSGLLVRRVGGPAVMPPQPDGVWGQIYSGDRWVASTGDDRHRRSLYTLWRRTSPHPAMTTFDAPSREYCVVHRVQTNTPLQALVTWNDPQFVECQAALAARVLAECGGDDAARLRYMFRVCLLREPGADELQRLVAFVDAERAAHGNGDRARSGSGADAGIELRAWTACASVLMNLDEFVTRG